jgi:alpha-tubulin suppressor-like RCC1 family protein
MVNKLTIRLGLFLSLLTLTVASTKAQAQTAPSAFTQAAGPISSTNATLNGMVVPNGTDTVAWFEWGTDSAYGQATDPVSVGNGSAVVRISATITNLTPQANFWCHLVASNAVGVADGAPILFTTGQRIIAWGPAYMVGGGDGSLQMSDPPLLTNVVAVGSGVSYAVGLNSEGKVMVWGSGDYGYGITNVPPGRTNVMAVAAGWQHCLALQSDGTVIVWGDNTYLTPSNTPPANLMPPADLSNAVAVAAGYFDSLALKSDGTVVAWGENSNGQTNVPIGLSNVVSVAAGDYHSLALKSDGTVVAWGDNTYGQTNVPAGLSNVVALAAGSQHSLALKSDGAVVAWGNNSYGQTNVPPDLTNVVAVTAGRSHSLALKSDGSVVAIGSAIVGMGTPPQALTNLVAVAAGGTHSLALGNRSSIFTQPAEPAGPTAVTLGAMVALAPGSKVWFEWGPIGGYGQKTADMDVPTAWNMARMKTSLTGLVAQSSYQCRVVASNAFGKIFGAPVLFTTGQRITAWGYNNSGQTIIPGGLSNVVAVAAGGFHSLALNVDGTVIAWGQNGYGQASVPAGLSNVVALAAGNYHSLALKQDGTVAGWGQAPNASVPAGLSNVMAISAGESSSLALKSDGTVVFWGDDPYTKAVPRTLGNVVALATGMASAHWLVVTVDGRLATWGDVGNGAVSQYGTNPAYLPWQSTNVVGVAVGGWHCLALKADGTVASWGYGTTALFNVPVSSNGIAVSAGGLSGPPAFNLVLDSLGKIVAWGDNNEWGVRNSLGQTNVPPGLSNAVAMSGGGHHSLALGNVPPQSMPQTNSGLAFADLTIVLQAYDLNSDPLTYRIGSLPAVGTLYQWTSTGRGAPITASNTAVADAAGRVIFSMPAAGGDTFTFVANDGLADSSPATASVFMLQPPVISTAWSGLNTSGSFSLAFAADSNVTWRVWGSTNLTSWSVLGTAAQASPGLFQFTDSSATNWPQRFYRLTSP